MSHPLNTLYINVLRRFLGTIWVLFRGQFGYFFNRSALRLMAKDNSIQEQKRDVTMSYFSTTCAFDFSIDEFRVFLTLLRDLSTVFSGLDVRERIDSSLATRNMTARARRKEVVKLLRETIVEHGKEDDFNFIVNDDGSLRVEAYINHYLADNTNHYERVKDAMRGLNDKYIDVEDANGNWARARLFEMPSILKYEHAYFTVNPLLVEYFIDLSRGYRRFDYEIAFNFRSVYASRIYILLSGQTSSMPPIPIIKLKKIFGLEDRYKADKDFIKRIIKSSQKEIELKAPFRFEYKIVKQRDVKSLKFTVRKKK